MKTILLLAFIAVYAQQMYAEGPNIKIIDPVVDFIARNKDNKIEESDKGEHVIKLEIDIDGDGIKERLLTTEHSSKDMRNGYENPVYIWDIYKRNKDDHFQLIDKNKKFPELGAQLVEFDGQKIYVGYIKELNRWGVLAFYYHPKGGKVTCSVIALNSGSFEELNFPDPTQATEVYHGDAEDGSNDFPDNLAKYYKKLSKEKVVILPNIAH